MGNSGSCWVENDNVGDMTGDSSASGGNNNPIWGDQSSGMGQTPAFSSGFSFRGFSGLALQMYYSSLPTSMKEGVMNAYGSYQQQQQQRRDDNAKGNYYREIITDLIYGNLTVVKTGDLHYQINETEVVTTGEEESRQIAVDVPHETMIPGLTYNVPVLTAYGQQLAAAREAEVAFFFKRFTPLGRTVSVAMALDDAFNGMVYSKGGKKNIWPDQYGPPPNPKTIDWTKSDSDLATEKSNASGDSNRGPTSAHNLVKKWFRDKRPR